MRTDKKSSVHRISASAPYVGETSTVRRRMNTSMVDIEITSISRIDHEICQSYARHIVTVDENIKMVGHTEAAV